MFARYDKELDSPTVALKAVIRLFLWRRWELLDEIGIGRDLEPQLYAACQDIGRRITAQQAEKVAEVVPDIRHAAYYLLTHYRGMTLLDWWRQEQDA